MEGKSKPISASVSEELYYEIEAVSKQQDLTKSQIFRKALKCYLNAEPNNPATALAIVQLCDAVEELGAKYEAVIDSDTMDRLRDKIATLVELERREVL